MLKPLRAARISGEAPSSSKEAAAKKSSSLPAGTSCIPAAQLRYTDRHLVCSCCPAAGLAGTSGARPARHDLLHAMILSCLCVGLGRFASSIAHGLRPDLMHASTLAGAHLGNMPPEASPWASGELAGSSPCALPGGPRMPPHRPPTPHRPGDPRRPVTVGLWTAVGARCSGHTCASITQCLEHDWNDAGSCA